VIEEVTMLVIVDQGEGQDLQGEIDLPEIDHREEIGIGIVMIDIERATEMMIVAEGIDLQEEIGMTTKEEVTGIEKEKEIEEIEKEEVHMIEVGKEAEEEIEAILEMPIETEIIIEIIQEMIEEDLMMIGKKVGSKITQKNIATKKEVGQVLTAEQKKKDMRITLIKAEMKVKEKATMKKAGIKKMKTRGKRCQNIILRERRRAKVQTRCIDRMILNKLKIIKMMFTLKVKELTRKITIIMLKFRMLKIKILKTLNNVKNKIEYFSEII
jgi:hypothetical protein